MSKQQLQCTSPSSWEWSLSTWQGALICLLNNYSQWVCAGGLWTILRYVSCLLNFRVVIPWFLKQSTRLPLDSNSALILKHIPCWGVKQFKTKQYSLSKFNEKRRNISYMTSIRGLNIILTFWGCTLLWNAKFWIWVRVYSLYFLLFRGSLGLSSCIWRWFSY